MIPFENDNLSAYKFLLRIEIVLRECLRDFFEKQYGEDWRKRIPGDLLKNIREAEKAENKPQFDFLKLGPFYYLTFGELVDILRQKVGQSVAKRLGGDSFVKQLENLFAPRNALCHSRSVSKVGIKAIESLYLQMETALSPKVMMKYLASPDAGVYPEQVVGRLIGWLTQAEKLILKLISPVPISPEYSKACVQYWWGNNELCGFDCEAIDKTHFLIKKYNSLTTGLGSIRERQSFCEATKVVDIIKQGIGHLRKAIL